MLAFLDAIWGPQGDGIAELRFLSSGGGASQAFAQYPDGREQLVRYVEERGKRNNVFFGVILRDAEGGTNQDVKAYTPVLWADFDIKRFGSSKLKTLQAVQRVELEPQIIVDSGHGYHAYWLLDKPVPKRDAQLIMAGIAERWGSDTVGDPARVMRLPGTQNIKDLVHVVPVRILKFDTKNTTRSADAYDTRKIDIQSSGWSDQVYVGHPDDYDAFRWLHWSPLTGQRSEYIFGIVCNMIRAGWEPEASFEMLMIAPAGEKMREMKNPERWFQRTWNKAVKEITSEP